MSSEDRRRMQEMMRRREEEAAAAARDPWGLEGGRRQTAVVFVKGDDGHIVPRQIVTGIRDWEYTEVLSGLEDGEDVLVLPSTSLLRSQEALRNRFRRFMPGFGGGPRRGGGGRRR